MNKVRFGIDEFLATADVPRSLRIGLVTNQAATTIEGQPSRLALQQAGFNLARLFSPEHGLLATGADGEAQADGRDALTGIPVMSLYGNKLRPAAADLQDLDLVVFDIPDVGCRFYTYLWTMTHVMEACAENRRPFLVLDRPNPLSGNLDLAEGPLLDETHCASFIGRWKLPVRHSCTLGELARYFAATRLKGFEPKVVPARNWDRNDPVSRAGWPFVPTSPAIRHPETALLYPGTGLLEGVNIDEGRGTEFPFRICGAPWLKAEETARYFNEIKLPGVEAAPHRYITAAGLYANQPCEGLRLQVLDEDRFRPVQTGLALIRLIQQLHPEHCRERLYPTAANPRGEGHLDKLTGVWHCFGKLVAGDLPDTASEREEWKKAVSPFLLY